jgi:hypothetical protein
MKDLLTVNNFKLAGKTLPALLLQLSMLLFVSCAGTGIENSDMQTSGTLDNNPNVSNSSTSNNNSGIIFQQNFNNEALGLCDSARIKEMWGNVSLTKACIDGGRVSITSESSKHSNTLRVLYPLTNYESALSGAQWKVNLTNSHEELYCSYDVKFQSGFEFNNGGKLPGLAGGTANSGGEVPTGYDGWSARMMWRTNSAMIFYVYHVGQADTYGDLLWWKSNGLKETFVPGQWYHLAHRVVLNTVGKKNGILEGWVNGTNVYSITNIEFRKTNALKINIFYFSTFFGGNSPDWGSPKKQYSYFDNFVISTRPLK